MLSTKLEYQEPAASIPSIDMAARQLPLQHSYRSTPEKAWITDRAKTSSKQVGPEQPLYGTVTLDGGRPTDVTYGVHKAVGGEGDYPVPGELLCAALASCLDSTIRIIANRLGIGLQLLEVSAQGEVDVRGTLLVDREVAVGFQKFAVGVRIDALGKVENRKIELLLRAAEHSCVVIQTLRAGTEVSVERIVES